MKENIQNLSNDQVIDMLPFVVDIYEKLEFDKFISETRAKYRKKKKVDFNEESIKVTIDVAKHILRNSPKIKEEIYEIVAIAEEKTIDEVKKQKFSKTIATISKILKDEEIRGFFT